jgi:hypothetical protein
MNPIDILEHPDDVCESEYRSIYECLSDALRDTPDEDKKEHALGMLEEFEGWAKALRKKIKNL